jgi:hypothetical protein
MAIASEMSAASTARDICTFVRLVLLDVMVEDTMDELLGVIKVSMLFSRFIDPGPPIALFTITSVS